MEEVDLIELTPHNYQEWIQLAIRYLSQHNLLPYTLALEYHVDTIDILLQTFWLHMDYDIFDFTMDEVKSNDPYDIWMFLWETYGDPTIPPFPKELIPPVAVDTSSDEITPPVPIAPTNPGSAIDASDLV